MDLEQLTFQTFPEAQASKTKNLSRIRHGSLNEHWDELVELNNLGACIAVCTNKTDLNGRSVENITDIRALVHDDDGFGKTLPLSPNITVKSSLKTPGHKYYLLEPEVTAKDWKKCQIILGALYGGDPAIKDLSRAMRLPGFYHLKSDPFLVTCEIEKSERYNINKILSAFRHDIPQFDILVKIIEKNPSLFQQKPDTQRTDTLTKIAGHLVNLETNLESIKNGCLEWNKRCCSPPLESGKVIATAESIFKIGGEKNRKPCPSTSENVPNIRDWSLTRYSGEIVERKYLVDQIFPLGVVGLVASEGGVGKSMMLIDLAIKVASYRKDSIDNGSAFGGFVTEGGAAVYFSAEDDQIEIHKRVDKLTQSNIKILPERLFIVPLPNAGGVKPLVIDKGSKNFLETPYFQNLQEQLEQIKDLKLVILDPLQALVSVNINEDPAAAQFIMSLMAKLAAQLKITIIIAHHMRKPAQNERQNIDDARHAIRGTSALVDGVRFAYVLQQASQAENKKILQLLAEDRPNQHIILGKLAKDNFGGDKSKRTYLRNDTGLINDCSLKLRRTSPSNNELAHYLAKSLSIIEAKITMTGKNGLHRKRELLGGFFEAMPRAKIEEVGEVAIRIGLIKAEKRKPIEVCIPNSKLPIER
jgi:hypothetical protein